MTDFRRITRASVVVHAEVTGDPLITDPGFCWLEQLADSWADGSIELDSQARPLLEWIDGVGLTSRAFRIAKNTTLSLFTTSGGSWETEKPGTSAPRVDHITQYDCADAVVYSATSVATQPPNPNFAFSLILPDTPPDWDAATRPPYVRVEFGGEWGVHFEKGAAFLMRKAAGSWGAVMELDNPPQGSGYEDLERFWVWVRCLEGMIGISMDEGRSYRWYPAGNVAPAKLTLRGQGGSVTFGLGQLYQAEGDYQPLDRPTGRVRGAVSPTITGDYWLPAGVSAPSFADQSTPTSALARWRATLTPVPTATGFGWSYYQAPLLRCVTFRYATTTTLPSLATSTPWDNVLEGAAVDKPKALDGATAELILNVSAFASFDWTRYRERKIEVWMGATLVDEDGEPDGEELAQVFTGYVRCIHLVYDQFGSLKIRILADNTSAAFRRPWGRDQVIALGGQSLNSAADYVFATEGFGLVLGTVRNWHALGDSILLDRGHWRELAELVQAAEEKWETLSRLFNTHGLELGVLDDGTFQSVPRFVGGLPYTSGITWDRRFAPASGSEIRDLIRGATRRLDSGKMVTTIQIGGTLANGRFGMAQVEDTAALDPLLAAATGRFAPRRFVHVEDLGGSHSQLSLNLRAMALGYEMFPQWDEIDLVQPMDLRVKRKDCLRLYDAGPLDLADGSLYAVETLRHQWSVEEALGDSTTYAGLRRA